MDADRRFGYEPDPGFDGSADSSTELAAREVKLLANDKDKDEDKKLPRCSICGAESGHSADCPVNPANH